ncbi:MAG TPA: TetR family transcriptional regulator [Candidatus Dormibacteraeota bacterium]|nr:TetR family transcriptional regulator [Candidatus Dormibacteraeota bacterium]
MTSRRRTPRAPARRSPSSGVPPAEPRRARARSGATRLRIIEAALRAFGEQGYDGAMTRDIAAAAGVQQPLINYHFGSKDGLWRAVVAHLFAELRESVQGRLAEVATLDPPEVLAAVLHHFVLFTAERPQLSRLMLKEAAARGERLTWIVDHHLRPSFEAALALIRAAQRRGALEGIEPVSAYYLFVGAATSAFVMGPAYQLLTGHDPFSADRRAAYADAVVRLFLPTHRAAKRRRSHAELQPPGGDG